MLKIEYGNDIVEDDLVDETKAYLTDGILTPFELEQLECKIKKLQRERHLILVKIDKENNISFVHDEVETQKMRYNNIMCCVYICKENDTDFDKRVERTTIVSGKRFSINELEYETALFLQEEQKEDDFPGKIVSVTYCFTVLEEF